MSQTATQRILYCHCKYANVVPEETKRQVLTGLTVKGTSFDAVPDLCEMSARRDPALKRIAEDGSVTIIACYPRAVQGLFHAAGADLPEEGVDILNMRTDDAESILKSVEGGGE